MIKKQHYVYRCVLENFSNNKNQVFEDLLNEKRIYPAININRSGTRREELLTKPDELQMMWILRKVVHDMDEIAAMEFLYGKLKATKTNAEFFDSMKRK